MDQSVPKGHLAESLLCLRPPLRRRLSLLIPHTQNPPEVNFTHIFPEKKIVREGDVLRASWFGAGRHCRPGARRLTQSFYSPPASSCNVLQTHAVVPSGTHPPSVPLVPAPLNLRSGHTPFPSFLTPERDGLERCGMPAEIASPGFPGRTRNERPPEAAADLSEGVRRTHSGRLKDRVGKQSEMTKFEPPDEP